MYVYYVKMTHMPQMIPRSDSDHGVTPILIMLYEENRN